jgi:hypothetical protein
VLPQPFEDCDQQPESDKPDSQPQKNANDERNSSKETHFSRLRGCSPARADTLSTPGKAGCVGRWATINEGESELLADSRIEI